MKGEQFSKNFMGKLCVFLAFLFLCTTFLNRYGVRQSVALGEDLPVTEEEKVYTVVLDAGHGGEDGGAVGVNGILEKDLNMSVARYIKERLESYGCRVVMTREKDRLLYTDEQNIYGQRKLYDLRNRLSIASSEENPILVSIHMNKFSQSKYSGLQIYYSKNHPDSRVLAEKVRGAVVRELQPQNKRQNKEATSALYLLHRAEMPAILIECGFLSNPDECARLASEAYQRRLACVIADSIFEHVKRTSLEE